MIDPDDPMLKLQLTFDEGRRARPYDDGKGNITIGIGYNLTANGLSDAIIDDLYQVKVAETIDQIRDALPWSERLTPNQQRVLVNIAYNAGVHGLLGFHKMLAALELGDISTAATEVVHSTITSARAERLATQLRTP